MKLSTKQKKVRTHVCEVEICSPIFVQKWSFFSWGEKIYWPEMPSKSLPGGTDLLTNFSKNIQGGRDLRGINLRSHRWNEMRRHPKFFTLPLGDC